MGVDLIFLATLKAVDMSGDFTALVESRIQPKFSSSGKKARPSSAPPHSLSLNPLDRSRKEPTPSPSNEAELCCVVGIQPEVLHEKLVVARCETYLRYRSSSNGEKEMANRPISSQKKKIAQMIF